MLRILLWSQVCSLIKGFGRSGFHSRCSGFRDCSLAASGKSGGAVAVPCFETQQVAAESRNFIVSSKGFQMPCKRRETCIVAL